jgi:Cu/Ag efflux pump CusA
MVGWLIGSAIRLQRLVVAAVIVVLGLGVLQLQHATVDLYPQFGGTQVQVQAEALGLSAQEVEQLITVPIEQDLLNGVPWLTSITSRSMPGLSAIDLTFEQGTDLWKARQMVQERMSQAKALPNVGTPPAVIQPTASTSRVAMIGMRSAEVSLIDMSVLARWQLRPRLMSIPGVAQVSLFGQQDRQLQVQVDPQKLQASNVSLTQLIETAGNALWVSPLSFVEASTPGTGGFVETPNQRLGVQHISPITSSDQLAGVAVQGAQNPGVKLGDVTTVVEDHQNLIGDASDAGRPSLMLVVERFPDANTAQVTRDVEAALASMQPGLKGITLDTSVYRPVAYLDSALHRLGLAVLLGVVLLALVIGVLGRSWRVAVVALASVTTSVMAALWVLYLRGETLTSMTVLGLAAVLALVIDDAVGDVGELRSRLRVRRDAGQMQIPALLTEAVQARRGPLAVASLIAVLALAPVFLLTGPAGALARPAVLTLVLTLVASLLVAFVVTPVLALALLRGGSAGTSRSSRTPGWVGRKFDGLAARSAGRPLAAGLALALLALLAVPGMALLHSGRTLPTAQDRSVMVRLQASPGTALGEMNRITNAAAAELGTLPGVQTAGTHVGRAIASDRVADVDKGEIWLTIADDVDYTGTIDAIRSTVQAYPGLRSDVSTYADDRLAAAGATTGDKLVVRVYGQDYATLQATAESVRQQVQTVAGVLSPQVQPVVSEPAIDIEVDLAAAQRLGLRPGDVRRDAATLISGLTVGSLYEQQAIFDVVVWGGPATRDSVNSLQSLLIDIPSGGRVRLGDVAQVRLAAEPTTITHDAVSRSLDITAQVKGRSAADVAAEVTTQLRRMDFPYEYRAEVVGDAVHRADTHRWILLSAVVAGLLSYLLLQAATASWRGATVLLLTVPFAAVGGLFAAQLLGGMLTAGVLAALFATVALALRQALVLVHRARFLGRADSAAPEAMRQAVREVAPSLALAVLATAAVFLPAAVMGAGAGLELLQPFAVTLLMGLITTVVVVLFVVPTLYPAFAGPRPERAAHRAGTAPDAQPQPLQDQSEEER